MAHRPFREHFAPPTEPYFRWCGGEITRIEGFSDAVFAFAQARRPSHRGSLARLAAAALTAACARGGTA